MMTKHLTGQMKKVLINTQRNLLKLSIMKF